MEAQSDFLISSPEKIISKLSVLLKNKNLLTAKCSERGNTFVTTILEVDKKNKVFICDGCDENLAEQMVKSSKILFRTEHLGALVTFDSSRAAKISYQGNLAFSLPLPSALRWLEQREFYRVRVPVSASSVCQIPLDNNEVADFKLFDISIRGFSLLNTDEALSKLFPAGAKFEKCKLILDKNEDITISFEIRSKFIMNPNNLNQIEKIGCRFTFITPPFENAIHGFMLAIEREILKKRMEQSNYAKL